MARRPRPERVTIAEEPEDEVIEGAEDESDDEVSNAKDVPLFSGAGFTNNRSIAKLRLVKLDNPGAGYKGEIPTTSTLETIGQLYGDGLYNIEAVNQRGVRLRVLENQRIALGLGPADGSRAAPSVPMGPSASELDRVERLATQTARESVQQANSHTRLVQETTQAAAAREREFMVGQVAQQQAFFASLMASSRESHQQSMAMMQAGHQQVMQTLTAVLAGNRGDESSAERLLQLFGQGLQLGRSLDQPDERPFWQEILQGGMNVLSNARAPVPAPAALPANGKGKEKLTRLIKTMRSRGIDIDQLLDMLESGGPQPTQGDADEDGDSEPDSGRGQSVFTRTGDSESDTD